MSDNIFDRLAELLAASGTVNWGLASELGSSVAGDPGTVPAGAAGYWGDLVATAQRMLGPAAAVDLTPPPVKALDRRSWTTATITEFGYLAEPVATTLVAAGAGPFAPMFSIMVGLQMGSMVGSLSHRALANFDSALPPIGSHALRFVSPNIAAFTEDHDLDPPQAHLWVAAHELVQNRLLAVPAVSARFRSLISTYVSGLELDPGKMPLDGLEAGLDPERLGQMLQDPSFLTGMFTGPNQAEDLAHIQAFLAIVEGYVGYLLDKLDPKLIPQLARIREAVDRRRATPSQGEVFLQNMLGIELRRPEYRAGTAFFEDVERRWGSEAAATVWKVDEAFPDRAELADPVAWAARTLLS